MIQENRAQGRRGEPASALTTTENERSKMAVDPLAQFSAKSADRILEPMDRISEVLFGLIMALTFTLTLGNPSSDHAPRRAWLQFGLGNHRRQRVSHGSFQPAGAQRHAARGYACSRRYQ
jgi:hypothetical protein